MANSGFAEDCLKAHNAHRSKHGAEPLMLNPAISAIAQKWADHIAATGKFEHSTPEKRQLKGQKMGENIAMKWSSDNADFKGDKATDGWYNEIKDYEFAANKGKTGTVTGHFTQVVWKGSKELGVGKAQAKDGKYYVVANYLPPGNYQGDYAKNVSPAKLK